MKTIGNIIWFVLAGWANFVSYLLAGLLVCLTIVGIPFGVQLFKLAGYAAWPFGRTVVAEPTLSVPRGIGQVLWVVFAGIWLAIGHVVAGALLCLTIIGIPFGIANFKLATLALAPFGKRVVRTSDLTQVVTVQVVPQAARP